MLDSRSFSMHLMWSMLNTLQLIMFILKYNIMVPPNAYLFFKNVEDFLSMKAEFIDSMLESLQSKLSMNDNGVISKLGTLLVAGVGLLLIMALFGALTLLAKKIPRV
jgi:hypothetical protein